MPTATPRPPADPKATTEARSLLASIYATSRAGEILSGQHNTPRELSSYSDQARDITGRYPTVWGQDFGFAADGDQDGISYRAAVVDEALEQHAAGSVITLMWHAVRPTEEEPVTFDGSICRGRLDADDWEALLTPGTEVHQRWTRQVDVVAAYLARLRDAGIPVLWRPYHEMNGDWFWWGGRGGRRGYAALYRQLHTRLVDVHGLHNLVWVWNANAPREDPDDFAAGYADFYPGHDIVDVLAADVYHDDYRQSHHDQLRELAEGRPIALGEVGTLPTSQVLDRQPGWAWFMTWTNFLTEGNEASAVRALFDDPRVRHRA
ncbi:glycosyl hydrolase [Cellulomonas sp. PhB143]|uniref:glycosyl hydrolase n=1 Tax=Cellulomonas sp. PhB143 TaxID=2485186 RepID=UPI000FB85B01|nr:glycosyl hydrolase [Cellulomonas sp. PhB143]ROS79136.1 mannan endo-1,4-beta-mannosidase [Cellulomonas sp. PhB143]